MTSEWCGRREFLGTVVKGLGGGLLAGCAVVPAGNGGVFAALLGWNDRELASLLGRQRTGAGDGDRGGVPNGYGFCEPASGGGVLRAGAVAYVSPGSRYFRSAAALRGMELAAEFLLGVQHEDGTIDLRTTNFHSPPDTGFVLEWVTLAAGLLREHGDAAVGPLLAALQRFVQRAAGALAVGGVHTPNHRWVICMALARAHRLFPDPRYPARIDAWLGEGIDIDPDGQFTERSTGIYSPLTDRCLITVARLLDRPALYEPVRRNLAMTLYFLHQDGTVATEGSRRQDQFRRRSVAAYYYPYRYMALNDGDGRFAAAARWIEDHALGQAARDAAFFAESPALRGPLPAAAALPADFERPFVHSKLVRIRRGALSATILADNPTWFSLHRGAAAVAVRCAAAFFGKGQFVGSDLRRENGSWVMGQRLTGPYWQPLAPEQRTGDNDWARVVRETRTPSEVQELTSTVRVTEVEGGFELRIEITGTDRVPVAVELGFGEGGELSGAALRPVVGVADAHLLTGGTGCYRLAGDAITFGPGAVAHSWTALRGALPKLPAQCVYLTGFTPYRTTLRLG